MAAVIDSPPPPEVANDRGGDFYWRILGDNGAGKASNHGMRPGLCSKRMSAWILHGAMGWTGAAVILMFLLDHAAGSGAPAQSTPPPAGGIVAHLEYREVDFAPVATEISVLPGARFRKEPVFSGPDVFRGLMCFGTDTNLFVPFAWDQEQRKLYVDANRNGDLTDDAPGGYTAADKSLELFRGVRLEFPSRQGAYRVLVDAHVFGQAAGQARRPRVFLYVRSLWEGGVELDGKKWYLAVMDGLDGRIGPARSLSQVSARMVLRPWEERQEPFLWWHATLEKVHSLSHVKLVTFPYRNAGDAEVYDAFNVPENLFFQDRAYRMDYRMEGSNGPANLTVTFNPVQPALGKLHVAGEYFRRVVLDGGTCARRIYRDSGFGLAGRAGPGGRKGCPSACGQLCAADCAPATGGP